MLRDLIIATLPALSNLTLVALDGSLPLGLKRTATNSSDCQLKDLLLFKKAFTYLEDFDGESVTIVQNRGEVWEVLGSK